MRYRFVELTLTEAAGIVLQWDTFTAVGQEAGESRHTSGILFYEGNIARLALSRRFVL